MSVENFDGNGLADQPSIIYSFQDDDGEQILELSRSGFGEAGSSPGDVLERETTKSNPTDSLPKLELPGRGDLARDDCGKDIPAFGCLGDNGCGKPIYVGRTCSNPTCERDWPAAVKRKVIRGGGKLEGLRRALYARYDGTKDIDFNHVVASPPDGFAVDSEEPLKRTLLIIKTLLEKKWGIDGFLAILHPYRIKKEYRKDQYEHGGEEGEGSMTWSDVLTSDNPYKYLKFEPHFHLFFPAPRASFDYSVAEAVEDETGWLFHRITKGEDSNVSVEDLDDLIHQLTYCFSHTGVRIIGSRDELASRMKGDLHNCYIPDGVEDECLARFCDAAPKLLGVQFANLNNATCDAEVSADPDTDFDESSSASDCSCSDHDTNGDTSGRHPLHDVWNPDAGVGSSHSSGSDPWGTEFDSVAGDGDGSRDEWGDEEEPSPTTGTASTSAALNAAERVDSQEADSPVVDDRERCGGTLEPMHEAGDRLEDEEWCRQAEYVSGLRDAYAEWQDLVDDEQEKPWVETPDDEDTNAYPEVVYPPD
jgi:hypothetical protein